MTQHITHIRKDLLNQIKNIISEAQQNALRAVDFQRVLMYWNIGRTNCVRTADAIQLESISPENNKTILARQYKLYLPTEKELKQELAK